MAFLKIDGQVLSYDDLNSWVAVFVMLCRKQLIKTSRLPKELVELLAKDNDSKQTVEEIIMYLKEHQEYMEKLIQLVQNSAGDLIIEEKLKHRQ